MLLNEKITVLRNRAGMSVEETAKAVGISAGELTAYEQGVREPSAGTVFALATLFEVSTDTLIHDDISLAPARGHNRLGNAKEDTESGGFAVYEYMTVNVRTNDEPLYTDCYRSFGWTKEKRQDSVFGGETALCFKRNRRMNNKQEINGLQRQCENALGEIKSLERQKLTLATTVSLIIGGAGTAFIAGAVFSFLGGIIWAMVVLGLVGFALWAVPYFVYVKIRTEKTKQINEQIEKQYEIIYKVCEQADKH